MDCDKIKIKRNKKSDKSKRNFELNGKMSSKHIRKIEQRKNENIKKSK